MANPPPVTLFLQQRPSKGGAQSCLARVLCHPKMQVCNPLLVTAAQGWLTQTVQAAGVPTLILPFPRSRSLKGRLWQNRAFSRRLLSALRDRDMHPQWIHGNDHWEALLTLEVARMSRAKSALFLRTPGMTARDYRKYRCAEPDLVSVVGEALHSRAQGWDGGRTFSLIHDGMDAAEILPLKPKALAFPQKILVIGSHLDWKGWADLTEAVFQLEQQGLDPAIEFHFTGHAPEPAENDLKLSRHAEGRFKFLGFTDAFQQRILQYDLVINPSRQESFGMAALEVVGAGVPLLSSRSGVIEQVIHDRRFLFNAHDPADFARAIEQLMAQWREAGDWSPHWQQAQQRIMERFSVDTTVTKLLAAYAAFG
uniref:Putative GT4 n=1 Tax=Magnetococcus massalia (strain MO-1) TaxID=451514 RepID=A0A1S7LK32_MAGMO|nr:Putative GT4 [Candidatus Magnetococcus massalia]